MKNPNNETRSVNVAKQARRAAMSTLDRLRRKVELQLQNGQTSRGLKTYARLKALGA